MAYDKRISELQDKLKDLAPDSEDPGYRALSDAVKNYADIRVSALNDLFDLINNSVIGASDLQDHWKSRVGRAQDDVNRCFGDAAKDVMLAAPLQAFWAATVQFEGNFFKALATVKTPQYVEDLLTHQGVLAQMIDKLQTIWTGMLSDEKEQASAQMNSIKDLDKLMQDLATEIEKQNQAIIAETTIALQNKMKEIADRVKKGLTDAIGERATAVATVVFKLAIDKLKGYFVDIPDEVGPDMDAQKARIQTYIEKLAYFAQAYRENTEKYRSLISAEKGGVLLFFKQTREQVTEYQKNNNLVTAQIMHDEAKRFLSEWEDGVVGEQQEDAAEFNAKIFDVIEKNWKVTEQMAKQFEDRFSGVFYSPLTKDTIESLTESYLFRQAIDSVNSRNITATIDNSRKLLTGSVDETVAKAVQPLEEMSTDWSSELKDTANITKEEFRQFIRDKLKSQMDLALNSLGELRGLIDPPRVVADFTREELDAMLRG